ncbi:hypothetical protein FSZ31_01000 [Sphingorhabdus soli]|uniref:Uncharacterized protein n=1 Tax=Flavisphingopyxis soli TaxID=2601267 RepID=A0A5C6ULG0_9SPHN|nr:TIGR03982 family His-Xaa-Ser system protein [Sphingorhabdus soli]TXC73370.1 hypothetical protein FSZ31_01000 [Sphingorhabdus soli]
MAYHQERYGKLVEDCDGAMRVHYQAKRGISLNPGAEASKAVSSAEVGLIVCQDYDLYQKWLMQWGLRENELALMRLNAVEERASDLSEVVKTHEIRF